MSQAKAPADLSHHCVNQRKRDSHGLPDDRGQQIELKQRARAWTEYMYQYELDCELNNGLSPEQHAKVRQSIIDHVALACDIRIAETNAQFGLPEVGLGILPSSGGLTRLVRAVGPAVARDIVLFGDRFPAAVAHRLGLVREVVDPGQALPIALQRAAYLSTRPALAVAWTKAAIDAAAESSSATSLLIEQLAYAALNRASRDADSPQQFA